MIGWRVTDPVLVGVAYLRLHPPQAQVVRRSPDFHPGKRIEERALSPSQHRSLSEPLRPRCAVLPGPAEGLGIFQVAPGEHRGLIHGARLRSRAASAASVAPEAGLGLPAPHKLRLLTPPPPAPRHPDSLKVLPPEQPQGLEGRDGRGQGEEALDSPRAWREETAEGRERRL
ncbi:hypothetical protein NDU88_000318 [Pleurodeles waltl]|uniref:Uncharacterized protein n=1 Tax=Pleurodeles waltl TaxID=8319 RepID=A0AAV7LZX2_PLEWA|nr:hypothetical protein NDU88_000318 [Pleurodeles waltl]